MKVFRKIFVILAIVLITYLITIYNLKIENVEENKGGYLITVNGQNYFFEKEKYNV